MLLSSEPKIESICRMARFIWISCLIIKFVLSKEHKEALKKISKKKGEAVTDLEAAVARAFLDLEANSKELGAELHDLHIVSAKEVEVAQGKSSIVIFVPFAQHGKYKKIQQRLVRELEKKLGKVVSVIAQRTILPTNVTRSKTSQVRPRSRTLTTVQNAILDDLVYPTFDCWQASAY